MDNGATAMAFRFLLFFSFVVSILGFFGLSAHASIIGEPKCLVDVSIEHQEKGLLIGSIVNIRGTRFYSYLPCIMLKYSKKIKITGIGNVADRMLERTQSISLNMSEGSSMGENGAVSFQHWEIEKMRVDGEDLPKGMFPAIHVEALDGE